MSGILFKTFIFCLMAVSLNFRSKLIHSGPEVWKIIQKMERKSSEKNPRHGSLAFYVLNMMKASDFDELNWFVPFSSASIIAY